MFHNKDTYIEPIQTAQSIFNVQLHAVADAGRIWEYT